MDSTKKYLILLLTTLSCLTALSAQFADNWIFSTNTQTYTEITAGTILGTAIVGSFGNASLDDVLYTLPAGTIPFDFAINNTIHTGMVISSNAQVVFGGNYQYHTNPLSLNNPADAIIAVLARDIQGLVAAGTLGEMRYQVVGTAPQREFVIQWKNFKKYGSANNNENFNFQLRLQETSNRVRIAFGSMTVNSSNGNPQVGIRGSDNTQFVARTTGTAWAATTAATINTATCTLTTAVSPVSGLCLDFVPRIDDLMPNPALLLAPANAASQVSIASSLNWAAGGGTAPEGYRFSFGTDNPPTNIALNLDLEAATSYTHNPSLSYSTTYYWQVVPYNDQGSAVSCPIWSFSTEILEVHDLAATGLSGVITPMVNTPAFYTVQVQNSGNVSQSTYSVKLYNSAHQELASVDGPTLAPGAVVDVIVPWTPLSAGAVSIYGKVLLAGDSNAANDATALLELNVQPEPALTITVGSGDTNALIPLDFYYKNSLYQSIYYFDELGLFGEISALSLYNNFVTTTLANKATKIWMGTTTQTDLSAGWIPSTQMTLVFDGTMTYPAGQNQISFPLIAPFSYDNGNLVVMFNRPMDTDYFDQSDRFLCQTTVENRARNAYHDTTTYNPANPLGGALTGIFPKTTFSISPITTEPRFTITPASFDFGDVHPGGTRSQDFTIRNSGGGLLQITQINLSGSAAMEFSPTPVMPEPLGTGASFTFTVVYAPTSIGASTATISITDNIGGGSTHEVQLTGNAMNFITIGAGNLTGKVPLDFWYKTSLFETLYYESELNGFVGMITGIKFYNSFVTDLPNMPTQLWLGTTTQSDLSAGWIPSTQLTPVFDGLVSYPAGQNEILIEFPEPYMYLEGGNLVLLAHRPLDAVYYSQSDNFLAQSGIANRTRKLQSDTATYDPANPLPGSVGATFPKTTLLIIPGGVGHISGTVVGEDALPIAGVQVNVQNRQYSVVTDAQGEFFIANVLPADYTLTLSKYGYQTQTVDFSLEEDETEIMNLILAELPQLQVSGSIIASDTNLGIEGAEITLSGYQNYTTHSTSDGSFSFPAVYGNNTYQYTVAYTGYMHLYGEIQVHTTDFQLNPLTMNEIAYAPYNLIASQNHPLNLIELSWQAPDPDAIGINQSFEAMQFPPQDWSQLITNTEGELAMGVLPTWGRYGVVNSGSTVITPTAGSFQAGMWWTYTHQDEWLLTPSFTCPADGFMSFDTYAFYGSTNNDHYYVKLSEDNGLTWIVLWDASTQAGGWNSYAAPVMLDLSTYSGSQIKLAFHADSPADDGLYYQWFIDNVQVSSASTGRISAMDPSRSHVGYSLWRFAAHDQATPDLWELLTPAPTNELSYNDNGWSSLSSGTYRWAVKAIYTNGVSSGVAFSGTIIKSASEPAEPQNVSVSIIGEDLLLTWDAVTTTVSGTPLSVDYYEVHGSEAADFVPDPFTIIDVTTEPSYYLPEITPYLDQIFFRIIAVSGERIADARLRLKPLNSPLRAQAAKQPSRSSSR